MLISSLLISPGSHCTALALAHTHLVVYFVVLFLVNSSTFCFTSYTLSGSSRTFMSGCFLLDSMILQQQQSPSVLRSSGLFCKPQIKNGLPCIQKRGWPRSSCYMGQSTADQADAMGFNGKEKVNPVSMFHFNGVVHKPANIFLRF